MAEQERIKQIRQECWKRALEAFGTAWIFEQRSRVYTRWLNILTYVGLAVPLAVGLLAFTFGPAGLLAVVFIAAGILGGMQALLSLWSLVAKWVDRQASASALMGQNNRLSRRLEDLARFPPNSLVELQQEYEHAMEEANRQEELDNQQGITEPERRAGLHAGLRRFQQHCVRCSKRPADMSAAACPVCGNYAISSWLGVRNKPINRRRLR